jgi:hypothetical protein
MICGEEARESLKSSDPSSLPMAKILWAGTKSNLESQNGPCRGLFHD